MGENGIPFAIIFTKADKLKPKAIERDVKTYLDTLTADMWEEAPQHFVTSASHRSGRDELLNFIDDINAKFFEATKK